MRILAWVVLVTLFSGATAIPAPSRIAVLDFENNGTFQYDYLSEAIADMLVTELSKHEALLLLNRDALRSQTASTPAKAIQVTKALTPDRIVMGSFVNLGRVIRLDARVVEVATGQFLPGSGVSARADHLDQMDLAVAELANKLSTVLVRSHLPENTSRERGQLELRLDDDRATFLLINGVRVMPNRKGTVICDILAGAHQIQLFLPERGYGGSIIAETTVQVRGGYRTHLIYRNHRFYEQKITPIPVTADPVLPDFDPLEIREAMRPADFTALLAVLENEPFERNRLNILEDASTHNYYTVDQVIDILETFVHSTNRVMACKMVYPQIVNKGNFFKVYNSFVHASDRAEIREWVKMFEAEHH